jgi:hypothetical protein
LIFCRRDFWRNSELFDDAGGVFRISKNESETEYKINKQKKNFWYFWLQKYGRKRNTGFLHTQE